MTAVPMTSDEIAVVFRTEYGRAVAVLVRVLGDIGLAEDAVADAFTIALARWPVDGAPPSPAGWIITTARRRAIVAGSGVPTAGWYIDIRYCGTVAPLSGGCTGR